MRLEIRSRGGAIGQDLRGYVERRLRFVLGRFGTRIGRVRVDFAEVKGPRGEIDRRCGIAIRLAGSGTVFVQDEDKDLGMVVDRVTDRVGQSVRRELERGRERGGLLARRNGYAGR